MRKFTAILFCSGLVACAVARPDRNAFLNERAATLSQLIAQVKRDPEVRDRFRRHFGMSDAELIAYLHTLHPARLTQKESLIVYSVPPDNKIKAHVETFYPGVGIYRDVTGAPILIAKCGNPLHFGPKKVVAENQVEVAINEKVNNRIAESAVDPSEELVAANNPMEPGMPYEPIEPIETIGGSPVIIPAAPIFSPWLLGALGLGVLAIDLDDDTNGTTVVPEPATMAALGIGLVALAKRRKARRAS